MPRHVDHTARRRAVAEALLRVVLRDGLEGASVRAVASEAGLSPGALRHFFSTQAGLQRFAFEFVGERMTARMEAVPEQPTRRALVSALLHATMPVDRASREDNQVWFAFLARAQVDPELRPVAEHAFQQARDLCREALRLLDEEGIVASGTDLDAAAGDLHAFADGLAFQAAHRPGHVSPHDLHAAIDRWLDGLEHGAHG